MADRTLTLVRHAKSSWRFAALPDARRPLGRRGLRDCQRVPAYLAERLPAPGLVLCSDAARAVQTCQAVADALEVADDAVVLDPDLYLADRGALLARIARVDAAVRHLMLIGHNPGFTDLYNHLAPEAIDNLPTFGVAHLGFESGDWRLGPGAARVIELIFPKRIRDLPQ